MSKTNLKSLEAHSDLIQSLHDECVEVLTNDQAGQTELREVISRIRRFLSNQKEDYDTLVSMTHSEMVKNLNNKRPVIGHTAL